MHSDHRPDSLLDNNFAKRHGHTPFSPNDVPLIHVSFLLEDAVLPLMA
jgi:hypothetical protein